jgi:hypothetical protein
MLAHRPRPLGGRIAGEGGVGDWLGERGNGMLDMCEMALLKEGRPLWNESNGGHPLAHIETED